MKVKVLVPLANGVEEMEAVIIIDILRRAGIEVVTASIGKTPEVLASRGVRLIADAMWQDVDPTCFDAIVLPGGSDGTQNLMNDERILTAIKTAAANQKLLAAVCAAPLVLQAAGVLNKVAATCHPGVAPQLTKAHQRMERVVQTTHVITSQGPGSSMEFALSVAAQLVDRTIVEKVAAGLILPPGITW